MRRKERMGGCTWVRRRFLILSLSSFIVTFPRSARKICEQCWKLTHSFPPFISRRSHRYISPRTGLPFPFQDSHAPQVVDASTAGSSCRSFPPSFPVLTLTFLEGHVLRRLHPRRTTLHLPILPRRSYSRSVLPPSFTHFCCSRLTLSVRSPPHQPLRLGLSAPLLPLEPNTETDESEDERSEEFDSVFGAAFRRVRCRTFLSFSLFMFSPALIKDEAMSSRTRSSNLTSRYNRLTCSRRGRSSSVLRTVFSSNSGIAISTLLLMCVVVSFFSFPFRLFFSERRKGEGVERRC
jgi:hypothetical protein